MMKTAWDVTSQYIEAGVGQEPNNLIEFLQPSPSRGFEGVSRFHSIQVPTLTSGEPPPDCWSLSVVTLTSIGVSLPNIDPRKVNELLNAVREGLVLVKIIEKNLNKNFYLINTRKAADFVWQEVDIYGRRLDIELNEPAVQGNTPVNVLKFLLDSAKEKFLKLKPSEESASIWPIEAMASYSLYRVCRSILLDCQNGNCQDETTDEMFKMLSEMICDILGACLTNLKHSICKACARSTIENMNDTARHVLILFGKTKRIMELLDGIPTPNLDSKKLAFIEEWRNSSDA